MMFDDLLPKSNLTLLVEQVLHQPSAAALPSNLSDEWLAMIARDLVCALGGDDAEDINMSSLVAPLALVIHILTGQHNGLEKYVSDEELEVHLKDYQIEIALEQVRRKAGIKTNPATMETIFRQRIVSATDQGDPD